MIITKEQQEALISNYIKQKHNQDECIGFIDGVEKVMELVKNKTMPNIESALKCEHDWDYKKKWGVKCCKKCDAQYLY